MSVQSSKEQVMLQVLNNFQVPYWAEVTTVDTGARVHATFQSHPRRNGIKKIDKDHYMTRTGEIREYNHDKDEGRARMSLRKTMVDLNRLIETNFKGSMAKNEAMITLTYEQENKGPMTDKERLAGDIKIFSQGLKRALPRHTLAYIAVYEPQESGAWHVHFLLKSLSHKTLWLKTEKLDKLWPHGMTRIERIHAEDVGKYFAVYFTDLLRGGEEVPKEERSKARIKGARLALYPPYFKMFTCSQNVNRPPKDKDYIYELDRDLTLEKEISFKLSVSEDSSRYENIITKRAYKRGDANE